MIPDREFETQARVVSKDSGKSVNKIRIVYNNNQNIHFIYVYGGVGGKGMVNRLKPKSWVTQ